MQMRPYLSFKGDCEAAFSFYAERLGGTLGPMFPYAGTPQAGDVPSDWQAKIMHGSVTVGEQLLMGCDVVPERYAKPKGFSLLLQIPRITDAERAFDALADEGEVVMRLEQTFWTVRFGMLVDRFAVPWLINCDGTS